MSRLMEYFNEVDKSAAMRAAHQSNPMNTMSNFGLSMEECDAILSGSGKRFAEAAGLGEEYGAKLQSTHVPETYPLGH